MNKLTRRSDNASQHVLNGGGGETSVQGRVGVSESLEESPRRLTRPFKPKSWMLGAVQGVSVERKWGP
jgi:hypothetical protein